MEKYGAAGGREWEEGIGGKVGGGGEEREGDGAG